jgi:hypothetical protein
MTPAVPPQGESPDPALLEALERRLRETAAVADPVPELVQEAARSVFALRTLDAELADLVHDSDLEEAGALLMRGEGELARTLTFEHGAVVVDVQVTEEPDGFALLVLASGATGSVVAEHSGGRVTAELDGAGRARLEGLPAGPVRLLLTAGSGDAVVTSWVSL